MFGKITREQLIEMSVGPLKGYPIDAYCHCVNHAGGVYHDFKVREKVAQFVLRPASGIALQMKQAMDQFHATLYRDSYPGPGEGHDKTLLAGPRAHALPVRPAIFQQEKRILHRTTSLPRTK